MTTNRVRTFLVGLAALASTAVAGAQSRTTWRPDVDVYPMWLHSDLTTQSGVSRAPDQKHFSAVWRINGEMDRATYSYVFGELDGKSRSNLDILTREMVATVVNSPTDVLNRTTRDFDFNSFVPGTENGWKSIHARRLSFETNLDNKRRHFEALVLTDGRLRVWTFLVNYASDFQEGAASAERLLSSVKIMNRIEVGDATDHYRATAFPSGRIRREATGRYAGDAGVGG